MMKSFLVGAEPDIESELVDLGTVPLTMLRTLDNAVLHRALRRVVDRTRALRATRSGQDGGQTGGGRID